MVKIDVIGQRMRQLRNAKMYNYMLGDYKAYKQSAKDFAKIAVENPLEFRALQQTPAPKVTVPLFSSMGFKMLKIWFLEKFRIKSPEEKLLKKMVKRDLYKGKFLNGSKSHLI